MAIDQRITGKTALIGLIGNPVQHSYSPQLHNSLSLLLGIDAIYIPMKIEKVNLADAVKGIKACGFLGFNVTMPYKEEILKYVDDCSEEVKLSGCANTVTNRSGRLHASNTDALGFVRSFEKQAGVGFNGKNVLIIGAGGAAASLALIIASEGAAEVNIVNRTPEKAEIVAGLVNKRYSGKAFAYGMNLLEEVSLLERNDIIINATPVGMHPKTGVSPIDKDVVFSPGQLVCDLIYNPAETELMKQAKSYGCKVFNGLGMLFYQGIYSYETWMERKIPDDIAEKLYGEFVDYVCR